jgi:signal recognition particle receptor subunit beta
MSVVNRKIIFTGPVGAGKTTAISSISDINIITTDEDASDMTKSRKSNTTVAMDYGLIKLGNGERVHLYGTPGQERFDYMWDILTTGGIGLVLLLDNTRVEPSRDLKFYVQSFRDFIDKQKLVIGITRMDMQRSPGLQDYRQWIKELDLNAPVFEVDARERDDVSMLIQSLLLSLDPGVTST